MDLNLNRLLPLCLTVVQPIWAPLMVVFVVRDYPSSRLEGLEGDEEMTADTHTYLRNSDFQSEPVNFGTLFLF